jgi:hypothetical protein
MPRIGTGVGAGSDNNSIVQRGAVGEDDVPPNDLLAPNNELDDDHWSYSGTYHDGADLIADVDEASAATVLSEPIDLDVGSIYRLTGKVQKSREVGFAPYFSISLEDPSSGVSGFPSAIFDVTASNVAHVYNDASAQLGEPNDAGWIPFSVDVAAQYSSGSFCIALWGDDVAGLLPDQFSDLKFHRMTIDKLPA